jgi:nitrite reductase/ring-hydroxylating ferredoxin subunit
MSLLDTLLVGRPNGLRARLRARLGGAAPASTPAAARPAPAPIEPAERALGLRHEPPRDVTPPDGYEVVLHKDALDAGQVIEIIIGGTAIAVANVDGTFYATSNTCPHAGGPMGEGTLDGCTLSCPYHGWKFDLRDGSCLTAPGRSITTYPVQVVKDAVCVKL